MDRSRKILIVDDEPNIVVPLQFLMEQNGYQVKIAESGEAAIDLMERFRPDLVLLDIMLPGVNGLEVCQMLREDPELKETKIVLVSALGRDVDMAKGMAMGADAYITKPFSNREIVARVNELLK
ncbi:MAG: response regulator [Desulfobacterales bacterium]|jgi:DNA-binding response OmpR family regulator|nr:response regulator [Desulfobacterales bacterium]